MSEPPAPLVPPDVDLRGLEYMPYYGDRLRESGLNARATDAEYRAAHNLWWSSWRQIPAASLPNDDIDLCKLADLGRDQRAWQAVKKGAMRGFVLCSDDRWYHRALSAIALDAWAIRLHARAKGINGASKRWGKHRHPEPMAQASETDSPGNAPAIEKHSKEGKGRKGKAFGSSDSPTRSIEDPEQGQKLESFSFNSTPKAQIEANREKGRQAVKSAGLDESQAHQLLAAKRVRA